MSGEVFLSYVRDNARVAEKLAADLEAAGVRVWLDRTRLGPGERWREAIRKAISAGDLFIACFSRQFALRQKSHMNEELTLAIEELRRRSADRAWFIPVVVDDSEVPDRDIGSGASLRDLQWVDLSSNWAEGVASIAAVALRKQSQALGSSGTLMRDSSRNVSSAAHIDGRPSASGALQPDLRIRYILRRGMTYWRDVSHDEIRILLVVTNHATSSATAPYIRLQVPQAFSLNPIGVSSRQVGAPLQLISEEVEPPAAAFIARPDFVIHPAVPTEFAQITLTVKGNMAVPACHIRYRTAASNLTGGEGLLPIEAEEIAAVLQRSVEPIET